MIDTHTHIYQSESFQEGPEEAVDRAKAAGVDMMILPAVDRESAYEIVNLHNSCPDNTRVAMGLHPTEVGEDWEEELDEIVQILTPANPVAIGEVGIDLYWDDSNLLLQKDAFIAQIQLAKRLNLPVIIHCREGLDICLECIKKAAPTTPLIFHSFTGSPEDVKKIREICDPHFGINGVVTFKNSGYLPAAIKEIGVDRILLETDSPYLAPVPKRGRRNESSYIPYVNQKIAEILGLTPEDVDRITTNNAKNIFKI
ncbi:MAG: TatD family hydrolase [Muribaculaceae bacterium]|nr:TatD family hydrolase [Muribaculaceae bacterium]